MTAESRGEPNRRAKRKDERWGRLEVDWPVSRCGSSDYRKRVPSMGSTRVQEDAEDQGVRRQKEEPNKRTKKEEQTKRNQEKEKNTCQYRGKTDTGGWKDSSLTLRMTAESGDRSQNDSLSRETELKRTAESRDKSQNGNWIERRTKEKSQEEEPARGTKEKSPKEEARKRKTTRQYRGKTDTGGWKDSSLTLRMTV